VQAISDSFTNLWIRLLR